MVESKPGTMNGTNAGLRLALGDIRARGPKALADSLADHLRQAICDGRLPAGTLLPASRSLAVDLEVSRGVVVRAYEQLTSEGYMRAHTGRGTVVGDVHATEGTTPPSVERFAPASPGLPALGRFPRRAWLRATERRAVVVEDDYDAEFRYDRSPVGALQGLAPDRVVYGGSVSKTLAPGLRLGWIVAPAWLAPTVADTKFLADIAAPVLDQVTLAILIETGVLDRHVRRIAARYAANRGHLLAAVAVTFRSGRSPASPPDSTRC